MTDKSGSGLLKSVEKNRNPWLKRWSSTCVQTLTVSCYLSRWLKPIQNNPKKAERAQKVHSKDSCDASECSLCFGKVQSPVFFLKRKKRKRVLRLYPKKCTFKTVTTVDEIVFLQVGRRAIVAKFREVNKNAFKALSINKRGPKYTPGERNYTGKTTFVPFWNPFFQEFMS